MDLIYAWFLSSFSQTERTVYLKCNVGDLDIDDLVCDINKLNFMAVENNGHSGNLHEDKEGIVSVKFVFANDSDWRKFCIAVLKQEEAKPESK